MDYKILAAALAISAQCPLKAAPAVETSLLTAAPPKAASLNEVVKFRTKAGYHFNLEAPQECGDSEAFEITKPSLKCKFAAAGEQIVSLKICDDGGTACMFEDFTVLVKGEAKQPAAKTSKTAKDTGLDGFLLNDPAAALEQAKKEHKLLFIDFFGRWCPPCRVMEDTVLTHPAFLEATREMVRISLDVDRPEVREWRSLFKPGGYPTYLIADAELNEIGRWSGSCNLSAFNSWVGEQVRWKDQPIEKAKAAAGLDEAGRLRIAKNYMAAEKWAEARKALAGINTRSAAYLDAQAQISGAESTETVKMLPLYMGFIDRFDGHDGLPAEGAVLDWIAALHKLNPEAAKPYVSGLDALIERLNNSKDALEEGYAPTDVLYQAATDMDEAGLADLSNGLYIRAAGAYGEQADKAEKPELAKGLRMSQARCLMGAKLYKDAAAVYGGLVEKFPGEYAFHRSYASALLQLKNYPEALKEACLAVDLSYGDIHSSAVILKARIELAQKNKAGALKTIKDALAKLEASKDNSPSASRGLKAYLKDLTAPE